MPIKELLGGFLLALVTLNGLIMLVEYLGA